MCHLYAVWGISQNLTERVLQHQGSPEEEIDVQVVYLRQVHRFCLYAATWCDDDWELQRRCGAALLRDTAAAGKAPPPPGSWSVRHEDRVERFLGTTAGRCRRPLVPSAEDEPLRGKRATVMEEATRKLSDGKFQCVHCSKYFKGSEYVAKHVVKMHANLLEVIRSEAHNKAACAAFLSVPWEDSAKEARATLASAGA